MSDKTDKTKTLKETLKEYYDKFKPVAIKASEEAWEVTKKTAHYVAEKAPIVAQNIKETTQQTWEKFQKKDNTTTVKKTETTTQKTTEVKTPSSTPIKPEDRNKP